MTRTDSLKISRTRSYIKGDYLDLQVSFYIENDEDFRQICKQAILDLAEMMGFKVTIED